jgi:hypothetical protein
METFTLDENPWTFLRPLEKYNFQLVQWLRLALRKEPNRVVLSLPSHEDGNVSILRKVVFSSYLEFRTTDNVHRLGDS